MTEAEMMQDLAAADAAGDTQLASAIAGRIKAARAPTMAPSHGAAAPALASHSARAPVPGAESAVRGAVQGATLGWGDEIAGAVDAALPSFARNSVSDEAVGNGATFGERYHSARDYYRNRNAEAKQDHGVLYGAGDVAGTMANPLTKGGKLLKAVGAGVAYGLGSSNADSAKGQAEDAVLGGAAGAGGKYLGDAAGWAAQKLGPALEKAGVNWGFRALRARGGDIGVRKPLDADAVIAAYDAGAFRPGTTVHFAAQRLKAVRQSVGKQLGSVEDALAAAGVEGPEREALAKEFEAGANALKTHTSAGDPRYGALRAEADDLRSEIPKPPPGPAAPAPNSVPPGAPGGAANPWQPPAQPQPPSKLTLSEVLDKKRSAQWQADKEYDKIPAKMTAKGEALKEVAGRYRRAAEGEIDRQGPTLAPDAYAKWKPVNEKFGNIAAAEDVAQEGAARAHSRTWLSYLPFGLGAMGGAAATGSLPAAVATGLAIDQIKKRGPSTAAWSLLGGSRLASKAAPYADSDLAKQLLLASTLVGGTHRGGDQ